MWVLRTVEADDAATLTIRLLPGSMKTIGRGQTADFTLDRGLLSRLHCRIINTDGRLEVEDLDSTNGTFVNDQQVKRKVLAAGDTLRIGRVELKVTEEKAEG
ncbi:MAG: FHA domain-containing protein [Vicinamibacterales bacterium]|jgi:pSer/pThr/pTyr-binding forkhead associated (FHA) protein|nr:hypothetical protein [Acidobacteriota bacterium]MDP7294404.1 FHA domain-containing protein [Vicinamibacterales bacterium]MDP7471231.1 FHA domain-containing protein [Vicinamibacterales bacterium]MDP7672632.1 FHA domain-containing protein [Vicinamibacterales bacterium]HJO36984.1 FHA domain-containing protein [Vicinamibacterales bacterium]|tara:strand:- start:4058 stop:4363 length:306 start_codon:yes stop_codon:yes gene_type:complete